MFFIQLSLDSNHALATTRQSCANKKVPIINVRLLADFFFFTGFWPKIAQNDPYLLNGIFLWVGPNGKVIAPGVLVICPVDKNRDSQTKKMTFGPNTHFFGMDCTFLSQAANWSLNNQHFQHERGVPDMRVPRVLLPPPQKWIFGPKTAKFGPKLVYLAKYFFWPKWSHARKKTMPTR